MANGKQIFIDMNILVDGVGSIGVSKSVELPKIECLTIENDGAMAYEEVIPLMKSLTAKIVLNEFNIATFSATSNLFGLGSLIIVKGSTFQNGKAVPIMATLGGSIKVLESSFGDKGKEVEQTIEIAITQYNLIIDNFPVIIIDVPNLVYVIGGVDIYSDLRNHIL